MWKLQPMRRVTSRSTTSRSVWGSGTVPNKYRSQGRAIAITFISRSHTNEPEREEGKKEVGEPLACVACKFQAALG
jgi:hypothetical protein